MDALSSLLGLTLVKGAFLLAVALLLGATLRRASGLARHRLWSLAFAALLALPALAVLLPPLPVPFPHVPTLSTDAGHASGARDGGEPATPGESASPGTASSPVIDRTAVPGEAAGIKTTPARNPIESGPGGSGSRFPHHLAATEPAGNGAERIPGAAAVGPALRGAIAAAGSFLPGGLLLVWLAGFGAGTAVIAVGIGRGVAQARRARPLDDSEWRQDLEWHRNFFGIRRGVRLLTGPQVRTPMTGGVLRPVVLVPEQAADWSPVRRRLVLLHELVHIRRYDVVRHLLTRLGIALYWFYPLAWLAGRSSAIAREQACDEEVLRLGIKPSEYASHLLALAEQHDGGRVPATALPMIQRSQLETRLMKILDADTRPRAAWSSTLAVAVMIAVTVSVGIAAPSVSKPPPSAGGAVEPGAGDPAPVAAEFRAPAAPAFAPIAGATTGTAQEPTCWPDGTNRIRGRFSGSFSTNDSAAGNVVNAVGVYDNDRIVQFWVDDLRLCMRTHGDVDMEDDGRRVGSVGEGAHVVLEAELAGRVQRLLIRNAGAGEETTWTVDGEQRAADATAQRWRDQMTTVLGEHAAIARLRGERSSLRGRISSIRGERSSLRGRISSIRGERSSLQGRISSTRGRRSSLNGEISTARGHVSSLRGQISSARGHLSSLRGQISHHDSALHGLEASRFGANEEELRVIRAAEQRHRDAIANLEQQIEAYDVDRRVAEIEAQIAEFDLEGRIAQIRGRMDNDLEAEVEAVERQIAELDVERRVAEIEAEIAELDVEGRTAAIEAEIEALDVDERVEEMEARLEPALRELRATIERIG